mgnify:CR=1 FL=1
MDTISIINEVQIKGNELTEFAAITISIEAYNYLCKMAMKSNVFAHMKNCSIEMNYDYFIDLMTIAHMAECNSHKTISVEYMAS